MFVKSKANYLITKRVSLGLEFGLENADDAFVLLREPNIHEMTKIRDAIDDKRQSSLIEAFEGLLPGVIVDHNFFATETEKMSAQDVAKILLEKVGAFWKVIEEYSEAVRRPLPSKNGVA